MKINPILQKTINKLEKGFSRPGLITFGPSKEQVEVVSTGIFSLDLGLGTGGWARGRIVEIYGPESSGKTSIALASLQAYQAWQKTLPDEHPDKNKLGVVVDAEHTLVGSFFKTMGIDTDRILYAKVNSAEEAFQVLLDLGKTGQIGFIVLDSIDALQNQRQLSKTMSENDMGGISKDTARFFREYSKIAEENEIISLFINQLKYNPGAMGNPETTPGGTALRFYASMRLKTMAQKPSKEVPGAFMGRVKIAKNKCSPPIADEINFHFVYARGVDKISDLIINAKTLGLVRFAGQSAILTPPNQEPETVSKTGGKVGFAEELKNNPELLARVEKLCYDADKNIAGTIDDDLDDSDISVSIEETE